MLKRLAIISLLVLVGSAVGQNPSATPTCDESCQNARQNLQIQNRLVWLTGGLVFVGLLQVGSMLWQAWLLKRTRDDVHAQARYMKEQTGRMGRQADLMNRQTLFARESIMATRNAADAAKLSAESTLGQFQAMKAKERARVWIGIVGDLNMGLGPFTVPVTYVVTQTGPTDGFIYASSARLLVSEVDLEFATDSSFHSIGIPNRLAPQFEQKIESVFLHRFSQEEVNSIEIKTAKAYFIASIKYRDIFGDSHETSIMKRWHITDLKNLIGNGNFAYWEVCGPQEANRET